MLVAVTQPSYAAGRRVTLSVDDSTLLSGDTLHLHATSPGSPVGAMVKVERRSHGRWIPVAMRRTTSRRGTITARLRLRHVGSFSYRVRALRTRKLPGATSRTVRVEVDSASDASLETSASTPDAYAQISLSGRTSPYKVGTIVVLQRSHRGSWSTVKRAKLSGGGRFSFKVTALPGAFSYRVRVARSANHISATTSNEVHVSAPRTTASVSTGYQHSCSVDTDGTLRCWGHNSVGQLGDGTTTDRTTPVVVKAGTAFSTVSAGDDATCAISTPDKALWCWGDGFGTSPTRVGATMVSTDQWTSVSVAGGYACAIRTDGSLWCVGGTYGTGLRQVGTDTHWVAVDGGEVESCGIIDTTPAHDPESEDPIAWNRTLWCWDEGDTTPKSASKYADWATISVGSAHRCGTRTNGTLWCWGANDYGQAGIGRATDSDLPSPKRVGRATDWASVTTGWNHTCGIRGNGTSGTLWCWGADVENDSYSPIPTPKQIRSGDGWQSVSAGDLFTCAIDADEGLSCWGMTQYGRLGIYS